MVYTLTRSTTNGGYKITISGAGDAQFCYVSVNDIQYTQSTEIQCDEGQAILCVIGNSYPVVECAVYVNGVNVTGNPPGIGETKSYSYTVTKDAAINLTYGQIGPGYLRGKIEITE